MRQRGRRCGDEYGPVPGGGSHTDIESAVSQHERFARQCEHDGQDPDAVVADLAGSDADVEDFWGRAGENLRAGKVRMVFVSDVIPRELRRVVEFLNGQMSPADVIAIEVKQYVGVDGPRPSYHV